MIREYIKIDASGDGHHDRPPIRFAVVDHCPGGTVCRGIGSFRRGEHRSPADAPAVVLSIAVGEAGSGRRITASFRQIPANDNDR